MLPERGVVVGDHVVKGVVYGSDPLSIRVKGSGPRLRRDDTAFGGMTRPSHPRPSQEN
jgi:hypothetical protein